MTNQPLTFMQRLAAQDAENKPPPPSRPLEDIIIPADAAASAGYVKAAINKETSKLASMPANSGRNHQLNRSAFSLRRFIDNGSIDEQTVYNALLAAAESCGLVAEDGERQCEESIKSGFAGSIKKVGARPNPTMTAKEGVDYFIEEADPTPAPAQPATGIQHILDAEQDFWTVRESLTRIHNAALSRMCAPWAVLAHTAARALTTVRPCITLPPIIGGKGSLNWFAAIAAPSGGGKGSASSVARELIDTPIRERNIGSGEGIIGAFYKPGAKNEPPEVHEAVLFTADEIDTLAAMNSRSGSTTTTILRSGFAGETLGFSYISRGRDVHIEAHTYRMTLIISVQPTRAGTLMDDGGGGTPQRFMWFPGVDPRITEDAAAAELYPLDIPKPGEWQYPRTLNIPNEARKLIRAERAKHGRGEKDALDGHAVFCREKFAFSLALLDGRTEMNSEDWRLSGIASEVSTRTRQWIQGQMNTAAEDEAEERGRLLGVTYSASDEEKTHRAAKRISRVARWVSSKLEAGPMGHRELTLAMHSRDRAWLKQALDALTNSGVIEAAPDGRWVKL